MATKGLTPKQRAFVDEYLKDFNATQAAIRAGYAKRAAGQTGNENLNKPEIKALIDASIEARSRRTLVTADRVLEQYARMAFFDLRTIYDSNGNLLPVSDWPDEAASAAIAGVDVVEVKEEDGTYSLVKKVKLVDRRGALQDIAKHLGMFMERIEHSGSIAAEVQIIRMPDNGRD